MSGDEPLIFVTGFEPYGDFPVNPSQELAKAVDGRRFGDCTIRSLILPVHHTNAREALAPVLAETNPRAVVHLGLAGKRARIALERVAVNIMDYPIADNAGYLASGEPCVPGGPAAYFTTLPIRAMVDALTAEGIPAYISHTAGTYLCNQTLYWTLHSIARDGRPTKVGFIHLPFLPSMVARSGLDEPSMDFGLMLRALETVLAILATTKSEGPGSV